MPGWEESTIEQLAGNRSIFYILKLEWEVDDPLRLAEAISGNHKVRYVFLYDHFLSSCSLNERREVLKSISCLRKLESLVYISHSTRVKVPVDALAMILRSAKKLETFELHGPNLVGSLSDFAAFNLALAKLPALKSFKLLPTYFDRGTVDLDQLLVNLSAVATLEELRLCVYCDKRSHLSTDSLKNLCRSKVLRVLDIRWPHLDDEHLTIIAKALRNNKSLQELRVGGNNLSYSCFSVAELLELNEGIERFSLACRGLGNRECCKALWEAIDINKSLKEITFENTDATCNRGEDNSALMWRVLEENKTLLSLRLYNMGIDDETCKAIGNALRINTTLRSLDIRKGNKSITNEGYAALANMLQRNYTLQSLRTNATPGPIKKQIDVCLKLNQSAEKLEAGFDGNLGGARLPVTGGFFVCSGSSCR